ncbi:MAG: DUF1579 domain-containing protein [Verrucomicrobiota bacterium JB023]|nr:DUF1579 domain-containing protein [Verrucomicrobiota bacterium JB023]
MKTTLLALHALLLCGPVAAQDKPQQPSFPEPTEQHQWLQKFVGEWDVESELHMEPGKEPIRGEGTETVTSLGGFWIVSELESSIMDQEMSGRMTIGFDSQENAFVATWVDSMTSQLWTYTGKSTEGENKLVLTTEGFCLMRGESCDFRDTVTFLDDDTRTMVSETQGENGEWVTIMKATFTRK